MRKGSFLLAGACAIGVLVAGCGGGGGDKTVTESSLSKQEYVTKANEICEQADKKVQTDFAVFLKENKDVNEATEADYQDLFEKVIAPNVPPEIEELRELGAPKGETGEVEAILTAREESLTLAEEDPKTMVKESKKVFGKASKLAGEYGLTGCATR